MQALLVAMGLLMWVWGGATLALVKAVVPPGHGPGRSAWLALGVALGAGALVALAYLVLPASVLSQGWSRETLQAARQGTLLVVLMVGTLATWRGHRELQPVPAPRAAGPKAAARSLAANAKRRP
jgi:hypothetical protein